MKIHCDVFLTVATMAILFKLERLIFATGIRLNVWMTGSRHVVITHSLCGTRWTVAKAQGLCILYRHSTNQPGASFLLKFQTLWHVHVYCRKGKTYFTLKNYIVVKSCHFWPGHGINWRSQKVAFFFVLILAMGKGDSNVLRFLHLGRKTYLPIASDVCQECCHIFQTRVWWFDVLLYSPADIWVTLQKGKKDTLLTCFRNFQRQMSN